MDYQLAKELKDAGFPQEVDIGGYLYWDDTKELCQYDPLNQRQPRVIGGYSKVPTLTELIEACDSLVESVVHLEGHGEVWTAVDGTDGFGIYGGDGKTPTEAVGRLYIALNKK